MSEKKSLGIGGGRLATRAPNEELGQNTGFNLVLTCFNNP